MEANSGAPATASARVARPMLRLALALVAGSALGLASPACAAHATLTLAALLGAWCGLRLGAPLDDAGARPSARARPTPSCMTLAIVFTLAALRADARAPPAAPATTPREFDGEWRERANTGEGVRGRVTTRGGAEVALEMPRGIADDGELVRVLPVGVASRPARGPVPVAHDAVHGAATLKVRADEVVRTAPAASWTGPLEFLRRMRRGALARCDQLRDPWSSQLARALLCGDSAALDPELGDLFTRTGLRHELAVSGMNVALLASFCLAPAAALFAARARSRRTRTLIALAETLVLGAYIVLSGNGAPVRRSAVAIALALIAPLFLRRNRTGDEPRTPCRADALSLWCLALSLECLVDPEELRSISLQLSYIATLGLILGTGPIARVLRDVAGRVFGAPAPRLGPTPVLRAALARTQSLSASALAASCAAVFATLPLCWNAFGEWSPIGVIATPLSVPLIAWLLVYGWAMIALPGVLPAQLFEVPARVLVSMLEVFDDLPWTPSPLAARPLWLLITGCVLVFAVLRGVGTTHTRRRWLTRAACAVWCALLAPWTPAPDRLEIVALDVGAGTAVAMRAPGPVYWLFDCGSRDRTRVVQDALGPLLARWEVRELHVALSHTDRDHAGGLDWVVERYAIGSWIGALSAPLGERMPHTVQHLDVVDGILRVPCPENPALELTLLRGCDTPGNEGSRSLRVELAGRSALLSGDAQDEGLRALLGLEAVARPCNLLLCPHHGAESPWLGALLDACRPDEVWISASARAPAQAEVERRAINLGLTRRDGPLTWTARYGAAPDARGP